MQITIHTDPVTGLTTSIYTEEPPELSPEEIEQKNIFWDDMFASKIQYNQRKKALSDSFWQLDSDKFSLVWDELCTQYVEQSTKEKKDKNVKTEEDLIREFNHSFIHAFIDSLDDKKIELKFKKNLTAALTSWETKINPHVFVLLIWQLDYKEQSLKLLENISCDFSGEQYDYMYDFAKDFRSSKLPLHSQEKDNILSEEKSNFLQIQKNYCTFNKLSHNLAPKNIKTKHNKI